MALMLSSVVADELDLSESGLSIDAHERRRRPRMAVNNGQGAMAMVVFNNDSLDSRALTPVRIVDSSLMGLGALSPVAVEPGSSFSLMYEQGLAPRQTGVVVHCEQDGKFFRLGLKGRALACVA
jgi:hypothetical protein